MAADGSIVIQVDLDTDNAEKEYSKLKTQIKRTADEINDLQQKKSPLAEQAEQLRQRLKAAQAEADRFGEQWKQGVVGADQSQSAALETVRDLEYQYEQVVKQIDKIDEKLLPDIQKYERMTREAGELRKEISQTAKNTDKAAKNAEKMGKAVQKASGHAKTFSQRIKNLVRQTVEFGLVFGAYQAFTNWIWTAVKANDEAAASMARFKAALLTTVQPLLNVLIPAFTKLVEVATQVMMVFARLTAAIFGTTVEDSADAAEGLWNEQNAIEGVGDAAKKTTRQLAAFDEINKLTGETSSSASTPEVDINDPIVPDFSGLKDIKLPEWLENIVTKIEATISDIRFELSDGFSLDDDTTLTTVLSTALGAFIGGTVTRSGGGLLLGAALGFLASLYLDKFQDAGTTNNEAGKQSLYKVLEVILPGVIGAGVFRSVSAGIITMGLASLIKMSGISFSKDEGVSFSFDNDFWNTVLFSILGAALGAAFTGTAKGTMIGLSLGATISLIRTEFKKAGYVPLWETQDSVYVALGAILLGALSATMFKSVKAGVIGLSLGAAISIAFLDWANSTTSAESKRAKETFETVLGGILSYIIVSLLGGKMLGFTAGVVTIGLGLFIDWYLAGQTDISGTVAGNTLADLSDNMYHASGGLVGKLAETPQNESTKAAKARPVILKDLPHMATGGVIPPNRSFLAVLGDQTSGTNIEAPLDTIVQAMQIALANGNGGGKNEAVLELDGEVLGRLMYKLYNRENNRIGVSLAGGMA